MEEWATQPASKTEEQRRQVSESLEPGVAINMWSEEFGAIYSTTHEPVTVVDIQLDTWYDWSRGMLYVHEDVELASSSDTFVIHQIDDHLYTYNLWR